MGIRVFSSSNIQEDNTHYCSCLASLCSGCCW